MLLLLFASKRFPENGFNFLECSQQTEFLMYKLHYYAHELLDTIKTRTIIC